MARAFYKVEQNISQLGIIRLTQGIAFGGASAAAVKIRKLAWFFPSASLQKLICLILLLSVLAEMTGEVRMVDEKIHKVVIIGSGPAACTAAIYTARAQLDPVMVKGFEEGGQLTTTPEVGNWPGAVGDPSGFDIMQNMIKHVNELGVEGIADVVVGADLKGEIKTLKLSGGQELKTRSVIIATGARARYLDIPSEAQFKGRGISACATCDGMFFRNKTVAVIGGGSVAFVEALFLANLCSKVYLIHRREGFRAEQVLVERVNEMVKTGKMELILNATVKEYVGEQLLNGIVIDVKGEERKIDLNGVFVAIGHTPATDVFKDQLELDKSGYIVTRKSESPVTSTSVLGVFAAGDCSFPEYHQAVVAAGQGCQAALDAEQYVLGIA